MKYDYQELFICGCSSIEHQFVLTKDKDDDFYFMAVHLAPLGFWLRLANAFLYITGHRSKFGSFQEICLDRDLADRLAAALTKDRVSEVAD